MDNKLIHDRDADQRMVRSDKLVSYLPQLLLYPLRGHGPPVILLCSLLIGFGSSSLIALVALILGLSFAAHYAIRVVENTSQGHARPPMLTVDALQLTDGFTWAAMLAPGVILLLLYRGAEPAAIAMALLLPAHWIALATTRSLASALHPLHLLQILWVTLPAYLLVCGLGLGAGVFGAWAGAELSRFLLIALWLYLLLAGCHLLGFVAYHRHEALGLGVQVERPTELRERQAEQRRRLDDLLGQIDAAVAVRDPETAAKRLFETPVGPLDARSFHEELYDQLKMRRHRGLALAQAARLIRYLLDHRHSARAAEILDNAFDQDARFRPEQALDLSLLGRHALDHGQHAMLERILACRDRHFSGDADVLTLDAIELRYRFEVRRDREAALKVIERIGDFSNHPEAALIRIYAAELAGPANRSAQ